MQESRSFNMFFFGVFFGCLFGIWKREKKCVKRLGRRKILGKKKSSWSGACLGLFITPSANFEATPLEGLPASKALKKCGFGYLWKDFSFQILKRHGTWKSNGWIKSYGSLKFAVRRLVRHPGFHDISAILTPILTHE